MGILKRLGAPDNPEKLGFCQSWVYANQGVEWITGYNEFTSFFGKTNFKTNSKKIPLIWTLKKK